MRLVNQDTDCAIQALLYLAGRQESTVTATELANELNISWFFVRRILQELNKKGIVRSSKGKGGGFTLRVPAHSIQVLGLMEIFQGFLQFEKCAGKDRVCTNIQNCSLRRRIKEIENKVRKELRPLTIQALLDDQKVQLENGV
jgi:Rrf2 family protein